VSVSAIERLNAVLVTAMQPAYLAQVRTWVERLDQVGSGSARRLYVYRVQNGRAANLATVLQRAMGLESTNTPTQGTGSASDIFAARSNNDLTGGSGGAGTLGRTPPVLLGALPGIGQTQGAPPSQPAGQGTLTTASSSDTGSEQNGMRITADEINNALVISATPDEYARIASALQQLDITPLQVVIDATIAEVDLTNQLQYGLQYYIQSGSFHGLLANPPSSSTSSTTTTAPAGTPLSIFQGFSYLPGSNLAVTGANGSAVILQALSQLTNVQVLSSPNLLVLNNQAARIQVGDEVPIATQSAVSTLTPGAPQVNTIEYRDTGVILSITPRVNASGLVLLDIAEEVSNPGTTSTSTISSPTISQRRVTSSIAVSDGQTIALGGLIQDSRSNGKNGIPVLQDVPVLGFLFGTHSNSISRTELIVLITPHVIRGDGDARAITDELRRKVPLTVPALAMHQG
jgi:general secretion pathway protein D